jgi:hypothetical protein
VAPAGTCRQGTCQSRYFVNAICYSFTTFEASHFGNDKDFALAICTFFYKIEKLNTYGAGDGCSVLNAS